MRIYKEERKPVHPELIKKWMIHYKLGDIVQISKKYDLSISTVSMAFKGTATNTTIKCITDYYKQFAGVRKLKKLTIV